MVQLHMPLGVERAAPLAILSQLSGMEVARILSSYGALAQLLEDLDLINVEDDKSKRSEGA